MKRVLKKVSMLALITASALMFLACGGGGVPEEVAEKYMKALYALDTETATNLASSKYKAETVKSVEINKKLFSEDELKVFKSAKYEASPAKISEDGNSATVDVKLTANGNTLPIAMSLIKEDGAWKVKSVN